MWFVCFIGALIELALGVLYLSTGILLGVLLAFPYLFIFQSYPMHDAAVITSMIILGSATCSLVALISGFKMGYQAHPQETLL